MKAPFFVLVTEYNETFKNVFLSREGLVRELEALEAEAAYTKLEVWDTDNKPVKYKKNPDGKIILEEVQ